MANPLDLVDGVGCSVYSAATASQLATHQTTTLSGHNFATGHFVIELSGSNYGSTQIAPTRSGTGWDAMVIYVNQTGVSPQFTGTTPGSNFEAANLGALRYVMLSGLIIDGQNIVRANRTINHLIECTDGSNLIFHNMTGSNARNNWIKGGGVTNVSVIGGTWRRSGAVVDLSSDAEGGNGFLFTNSSYVRIIGADGRETGHNSFDFRDVSWGLLKDCFFWPRNVSLDGATYRSYAFSNVNDTSRVSHCFLEDSTIYDAGC